MREREREREKVRGERREERGERKTRMAEKLFPASPAVQKKMCVFESQLLQY